MTSTFNVELIKPSHYDDDGYVIQWRRAWVPSNSLSSVFALVQDAAGRRMLGEDVDITLQAYDETTQIVPFDKIIQRIKHSGSGLICLVGVQSNQYPRALDIARQFRAHDIQVAIGGFHVSGCLSMLPEMPSDLHQALDMGVSLFAGEAEIGRMDKVLQDAAARALEPIYNYMDDLPDLEGQPPPYLPLGNIERYVGNMGCFDAGRGCPFACSFCTIINVQGRKSRYRDADDVEKLMRNYGKEGVRNFFITDDNFARNKNWESIFDRIIELKEQEGFKPHFAIQVDTLCHRIPNFVEKSKQAGCRHVFIGLENINPANLKSAQKRQNRITEYRRMLQAWRNAGVITFCGYILGFPGDTIESMERDIEIVKNELPVDLLEFFILTPLPGSADHRDLYTKDVWMDPDMNIYDLEHVTTPHPTLSPEELQRTYRRAWDIYYSEEHIETLLKRALISGIRPGRLMKKIFYYYASVAYENVHPLQIGVLRIKDRTQRRHGMKLESPLLFYPRRVWEFLRTYGPAAAFYLRLKRIQDKIEKDPAARDYTDLAITPVLEDSTEEHLEMYEASAAAVQTVARVQARKTAVVHTV